MSERSQEGQQASLAATLRYDGGDDGAPVVSASGQGELAQRIVALAEEAGVPLYQDPELARLLTQMDLGQEIPAALYGAVAEVIAFVWSLDASEDGSTPSP